MSTSAARLLATAIAGASMALTPLAASAAPMPASETDDCLAQKKIWLVVQDSKDELLVNKCVEPAATGAELLTKAGVKTTKDAKGQMICTIAGEPAKCPASFDGNFWHYYTATKDGKWTFSQKGADQAKPVPGTLEGWCYGKECTPAMPGATPAASASSSAVTQAAATASVAPAPASDEKKVPWLPIALGLLALAALAAWLLGRRKPAETTTAAPRTAAPTRLDERDGAGATAAPRRGTDSTGGAATGQPSEPRRDERH